MGLSYKKLFKMLIDRDLKKKDLCEMADISTTSVTKLAKNQNVNTEILGKICKSLDCDICDIAEYVPDKDLKMKGEGKNE